MAIKKIKRIKLTKVVIAHTHQLVSHKMQCVIQKFWRYGTNFYLNLHVNLILIKKMQIICDLHLHVNLHVNNSDTRNIALMIDRIELVA